MMTDSHLHQLAVEAGATVQAGRFVFTEAQLADLVALIDPGVLVLTRIADRVQAAGKIPNLIV